MKQSPSSGEHRNKAGAVKACCSVITCSDSRNEEADFSGQLIKEHLTAAGHVICDYKIIKDDLKAIRHLVLDRINHGDDVIIINGGTGISRRDVTYDVISSMFEKNLPGFGELFRMLSYQEIGAAAMLSRAAAGTIGGTIVFSLPGSSNAVRLAMEKLIMPELKHLVYELTR